MTHLIPLQAIIFASFIAGIWAVYGVQPSISDSWYTLGKKHPLFTLWLWAVAFTIGIIGGINENVFYFLSCACLCFVGAAAEFKEKLTGIVHVVGAVGGIGLAFAGQVYEGMWIPLVVFIAGAILIYKIKRITNKTWWVENLAFVCIESGFIASV
jgi:hypothetical protein